MATRFSVGQRVTATVHGVTLYGTVAKIGPGIVFVRWDGGRLAWMHSISLSPLRAAIYGMSRDAS